MEGRLHCEAEECKRREVFVSVRAGLNLSFRSVFAASFLSLLTC